MSDVSVIGTGTRGAALVEALSASGAEVVVWRILVNVGYVRDIPLGGGEADGRLLKSIGYRF